MKRSFATLLAAMLFVGASIHSMSSAAAQDWPNKPVRIVNTFAPGGAADYLARTVADSLSTVFGQQFFVETRSGAAGASGRDTTCSSTSRPTRCVSWPASGGRSRMPTRARHERG